MTEMNKDFERELADVRANFNTMANLIRNRGVRRTEYPVPRMGMTFLSRVDLNYWYSRNVFYKTTRLDGHGWHANLQNRFSLHKAVEKCMALARPADWHQLLLEWPHVSDTDPSRLAYTRDERSGEDDRQVITTIGKYITRHFPTLASHHVRDITALFASDKCKQVHTTAEMIMHLSRGPKSCMQWSDNDINEHPYRCYDPRLGWSMAVREEGGDTVARALVYKRGDGKSYFVRSYTKNDNFSHSDTILEAWLNSQGINKRSDWEGAQLARVERGSYGRLIFPYLDGDCKTVDDCGDYLLVTESGDFQCDNTDGTADDSETRSCEDCGARENEDDGYWVGMDDDSWVCESCRDNEYTYVTGRRGRMYYVANDDAIECNGDYYDEDFIGDNNIVRLHDGDYVHMDSATYIESEGEWYHIDDEETCCDYNGEYQMRDKCVELHNGEYCLEVDAWQCTHSDEWYVSGDDDYVVTAAGDIIHPDYADECEMPEGYGASDAEPTPAPEIVAEVAVEPSPFPTRSKVVYNENGLVVTRAHFNNVELVRYQAVKRVMDRELCVAHNGLFEDFVRSDGLEQRIVTDLCVQIATMEADWYRQVFDTQIGQRYGAHLRAAMRHAAPTLEQALTDAVIYGQSFTHIVHDELETNETTGE